jgi:O-antigen/teichoic acid export membrane protein
MTVPWQTGARREALRHGRGPGALEFPLAILRSPLTRNGYALVMSAALTSALGLLFWIVAARLYTAEQVGLGGALLAALLTIGNMAQLNLGNVLNRFLPVAGARTGKLVGYSYALGVAAAIAISGGFVLAAGSIAPGLAFLAADPLTAAWFVSATAVWTLFVLQDSVLAGLRQSAWIPLENAMAAVAKIGILLVLAGTTLLGSGIFFAWIAPLPIIVAAFTAVIFVRLVPLNNPQVEPTAGLSMRGLARFFGWDYAGTVAMMLALGVAPLLVLNMAGAEALADYHLAWTISYSLYLIGRSMGISLLAEGAADRNRIAALAADALVHTLLLLTGALVIVIAGAPLIMSLFGQRYLAEGVDLLRILALSCLPWSFNTLYLAVARANGSLLTVAIAQIATLILALGIGTPLLLLMGAKGMGAAWLAAHSLVAVGIAIHLIVRSGPGHILDWMLTLGSSVSRLTAAFRHSRPEAQSCDLQAPPVRELFAAAGEPDVARCRPLAAAPSQSDVRTIYLGAAQEPVQLIFKTTSTAAGVKSLERYHLQVRWLRADPRLAACDFRIPEVLAFRRTRDAAHLIERRLPGEDGRTTILRQDARVAALSSAVRAIAFMHERTAAPAVIGEGWVADWIDRPARHLLATCSTLMSLRRRRAAIDVFTREQRKFWLGRELRLGLGHGDFGPGNLLFTSAQGPSGLESEEAAEIAVSAIVDWDRARADAPSGLDLCHLVLTVRTLLKVQEMGQVVSSMLREPAWSAEEESWLAAAQSSRSDAGGLPRDRQAIRAMIGLAWLHHVAANLEKSGRYASNRYWTAWNVEKVLWTYLRRSAAETA